MGVGVQAIALCWQPKWALCVTRPRTVHNQAGILDAFACERLNALEAAEPIHILPHGAKLLNFHGLKQLTAARSLMPYGLNVQKFPRLPLEAISHKDNYQLRHRVTPVHSLQSRDTHLMLKCQSKPALKHRLYNPVNELRPLWSYLILAYTLSAPMPHKAQSRHTTVRPIIPTLIENLIAMATRSKRRDQRNQTKIQAKRNQPDTFALRQQRIIRERDAKDRTNNYFEQKLRDARLVERAGWNRVIAGFWYTFGDHREVTVVMFALVLLGFVVRTLMRL